MTQKLAIFLGQDVASINFIYYAMAHHTSADRCKNWVLCLPTPPPLRHELPKPFQTLKANQAYEVATLYLPRLQQVCEQRQIPLLTVPNVNAPEFRDLLTGHQVTAGLSIRCLQLFKAPVIQWFQQQPGGFLWNLHPGPLPGIRGVYPYFRVMQQNMKESWFTLHQIEEGIDTGAIIATFPVTWQLQTAMETGVKRSFENINLKLWDKVAEGHKARAKAQPIPGPYYSYPTAEEVDEFLSRGYRLD